MRSTTSWTGSRTSSARAGTASWWWRPPTRVSWCARDARGSRSRVATRTPCSRSRAAPRSWRWARACPSGAAARWRSRSTCRARSRTCSSTPSWTSCTCTSRSRPARHRRRCATRGRSTWGASTGPRSACSPPRWPGGWWSCSSAASTAAGQLHRHPRARGALLPRRLPLIPPGADLLHRADAESDGAPEIVFSAEEERGALRLFLRALRRLSVELDWRATIWLRDPATAPAVTLPRRLRDRVQLAGPGDGSEAQHLARAGSWWRPPRARRPRRSSCCARWPAARCRWWRACRSTRRRCATASWDCSSSRATR